LNVGAGDAWRSVAYKVPMLISKLLIVSLLLAAPVAADRDRCGATKDEVLQIGRRIEKELPLGSTESQVAKFLDDMHLMHKEPWVFRNDPVRRYRKLRQTGATIENSSHTEPVMYLQFYFDKNGKLVESLVTNACGLGCYSVRPNKSSDRSGEGVFRDICR
jgi:hypothetical protein